MNQTQRLEQLEQMNDVQSKEQPSEQNKEQANEKNFDNLKLENISNDKLYEIMRDRECSLNDALLYFMNQEKTNIVSTSVVE